MLRAGARDGLRYLLPRVDGDALRVGQSPDLPTGT
jgi:hypothetical protein